MNLGADEHNAVHCIRRLQSVIKRRPSVVFLPERTAGEPGQDSRQNVFHSQTVNAVNTAKPSNLNNVFMTKLRGNFRFREKHLQEVFVAARLGSET